MAEKFPPIEDLSIADEPVGDFLSREKAILGDKFVTSEDPSEFDEFQSNFPPVASTESVNATESINTANVSTDSEIFDSTPVHGDPEAVKQWRSKREAEIAEKDKMSEVKHEEIIAEARGLIDQFYEDYSSKKEVKISQAKDEEADFISKRDAFFKNDSSIWDRSIKLIELKKTSGSIVNGRDKTKFKELLLQLKGKEKVPGAAGY